MNGSRNEGSPILSSNNRKSIKEKPKNMIKNSILSNSFEFNPNNRNAYNDKSMKPQQDRSINMKATVDFQPYTSRDSFEDMMYRPDYMMTGMGSNNNSSRSKDQIDQKVVDDCSLFIGDLHINCQEEEVQELFSSFGEVTSVKIMRSLETGRNLSYGFVSFLNKEDADEAIKGLHGYMLGGRKLRYFFVVVVICNKWIYICFNTNQSKLGKVQRW
jgi:hypothetical protein